MDTNHAKHAGDMLITIINELLTFQNRMKDVHNQINNYVPERIRSLNIVKTRAWMEGKSITHITTYVGKTNSHN